VNGGEHISLTDDEFDRLADFAAGILSARDEAETAELVRTDARWGQAHTALLRADAAVRTELHAAATPVAMPADVADRLDAAIAAAGTAASLTPPAGRGSAASGHTEDRAGGTRSNVVSIDSRRRRRMRLGLQVAGAAAAVVAVVFGMAALGKVDSQSGTATSAPAMDSAGGGAVGPVVPGSTAPVIRSGRNYQPSTLDQLSRAPFAASAPAPAPALNGSKSTNVEDAAPNRDALQRLSAPSALTACLAAIAPDHPGTVTVVDYAQFEGVPALLVLVQEDSTRTVVVVGENCGAGGSDEKDSVVVA